MSINLFRQWLYYVAAWCIYTMIFSMSAVVSLRTFVDYFELQPYLEGNEMAVYTISDYQFLEGLIFGSFYGTFFFLINLLIDKTGIHRLSYWKVILLKSTLYTVTLILAYLIVYTIILTLQILPDPTPFDLNSISISGAIVLFILVFFTGGSLVINFFWQINKSYGPGGILQILLGRYHKPQVENRIFIFIDLKGSTTIAEELGHIKYSKLIQKLIHDLNEVAQKYSGEIYQYVGDGVILTWTKRTGLKDLKCIQFFYSFHYKISKRKHYYQKRFNLTPEFKAGIHLGEVTVAEIGDIKRELAFHGDVVNTAARIQDACNKTGKQFLASKSMAWWIPKNGMFKVESVGTQTLKGKAKEEELFSINPHIEI
ncbi:adenylate/guanylate cyclase domain-containing protein [Bacteroidota bacterium]